jgi:hypothetical protein
MKLSFVLCTHFRKTFPQVFAAVFILLAVASCRKENTVQYPIPSGLKMISSGYATGAATKVEIYAAQDLYVGYNKLYIALYDSASNARITQAQVSLSALTCMGVSGPVENPASTTADNGLFNAAALCMSAGSWTLATHIGNVSNGNTGNFASPVVAVQASPARSYSVTTSDHSNLFVSIVQPTDPQLGVNTLELVIDRQTNDMSYTPDSAYMVAINPTMPSMTGMSSPNNMCPVYTGRGHYTGKVDFIMSGGWRIYIDLLHNGAVCDTSHYFDLNL